VRPEKIFWKNILHIGICEHTYWHLWYMKAKQNAKEQNSMLSCILAYGA